MFAPFNFVLFDSFSHADAGSRPAFWRRAEVSTSKTTGIAIAKMPDEFRGLRSARKMRTGLRGGVQMLRGMERFDPCELAAMPSGLKAT